MSTEFLKLILDIVVLAGLGGFMYYALRLSKALNAFRANRNEFEALMNQLDQHIEQAQVAVKDLKENSKVAGDDLHTLIRDAQKMSDELQLMTQAGDGLAGRLEDLAARNRRIAQGLEDGDEFVGDGNIRDFPKETAPEDKEFTIQDREFEDDEEDSDLDMEGLSSAAEKELYQALKKTKA